MNNKVFAGCIAAVFLTTGICASSPMPFKTLARMPVEEVTVFKDGHAFVLHSGRMPTNDAGDVVLDYLPSPVIGTFWPFSSEKKAELSAVTASRHKVLVERTALTLREMIEANIGAQVIVTEEATGTDLVYPATIVEIPARSGEELEAVSRPHSGDSLTQKGSVVLFKTDSGTKVVEFKRILDIRFRGAYRKTLAEEEFRNLLTLRMEWDGGDPQDDVDVGLLYLQRGIRWIPSYKVTIDGKGNAVVKLQATLINELADLEDVTAHLVIGVPTFEFKDTPDPMSLQQTVAQLSQYFRQDAQTAQGFSNAIMSQMAAPVNDLSRTENTLDLGPEVTESGKNEDLFIFAVEHVSLRKGQRMVVTVGEFTMKYEDVFQLDIPFAPPPEIWRNFNSNRQAELARLFSSPVVMHKIRLFNSSDYPLTTAPALILKDGRLLAQGLMTYAAPGADTDLGITAAVDIRIKKSDSETKRTPNAATWQNDTYGRIDLAGKVAITSFREDPVTIEVSRHVLGNVDSADHDGLIEMVNIFEDSSFTGSSGKTPLWWSWGSWPWWWHHFNGVGRISWTVELQPGVPQDLLYSWHYYWR